MTDEEIQQYYYAALDSVSLINKFSKKQTLTDGEREMIQSNVDHLKIVMRNNFLLNSTHDLTPISEAITLGETL